MLYSVIIILYFDAKIVIFGKWKPLQAGFCCPFHMFLSFSEHFPCALPHAIPGSSCTFPAAALELAISPRTMVPFSREWYLEAFGTGSAAHEICGFERPGIWRGKPHQPARTNPSFTGGTEARTGSFGPSPGSCRA